jgi:excinuclease ABC subunit B
MQFAIDETARRRAKQEEYNKAHGITPESIKKNLTSILDSVFEAADYRGRSDSLRPHSGLSDNDQEEFGTQFDGKPVKLVKHIEKIKKQMLKAAGNLEFEEAARLRDELKKLEALELGLG